MDGSEFDGGSRFYNSNECECNALTLLFTLGQRRQEQQKGVQLELNAFHDVDLFVGFSTKSNEAAEKLVHVIQFGNVLI